MSSPFNQQFWQVYQRFLSTPLITELSHPKTINHAQLAQKAPEIALRLLFSLDQEVLAQFRLLQPTLQGFNATVNKVLQSGGRIWLVGCGASARMCAQIEYLAHYNYPKTEQIQAVIAGGDIALIEAVEGCEDHPEYATKQLEALGVQAQDLVLGLSASGESPFILAAIAYAKDRCRQQPWLLYTNPRASLLQRNPKHILQQKTCQGLELTVGPMALTGSTRMQATTMMTLVLLQALFPSDVQLESLEEILAQLPIPALSRFAEFEAQVYQQQNYLCYYAPSAYALSVLADTTERMPTFNVPKFEPKSTLGLLKSNSPAWTYFAVAEAHSEREAWQQLLLRTPRSLNWEEIPQTLSTYLQEFDLSPAYARERALKLSPRPVFFVSIEAQGKDLVLSYEKAEQQQVITIPVAELSLPMRQLLFRLILVNHSTLVFGRLGFYRGNLMTHVKPSNFKLVDRAVRYIQFLAQNEFQCDLEYQSIAKRVLQLQTEYLDQGSIVEKVLAEQCSIQTRN